MGWKKKGREGKDGKAGEDQMRGGGRVEREE